MGRGGKWAAGSKAAPPAGNWSGTRAWAEIAAALALMVAVTLLLDLCIAWAFF